MVVVFTKQISIYSISFDGVFLAGGGGISNANFNVKNVTFQNQKLERLRREKRGELIFI